MLYASHLPLGVPNGRVLYASTRSLMSRPHQLWMYVGKDDKSRVISADLSDEELRDEVRHLLVMVKHTFVGNPKRKV